MRVLNEYPGSHHYIDEYQLSDYFCPGCGKKSVWEEQGEGDYYQGPKYICTMCGKTFYINGGSIEKDSILDQLRTGFFRDPTTKRGC